ncbi:MAG TPA: UvrD-helicase domain-containing protein [Bacteroidia bacterium]|jgi:DNA helicase-2/ATP-dependent DNA helicase PcrA|nr:UvrD-helicase domain-containing protein [Bacteroidia bacterium]
MMGTNKLIVAAAGSGKTTFLVEEALKQKAGKVLITTFTQANEQEIRKKIIEVNHCIPGHIVVQTWFTFLLQHGVRPFQGCVFDKKINGLILVSGQSGLKFTNSFNKPFYYNEDKEFEQHYFSGGMKIYSDKLAKFVIRCNEKSGGSVIERLSKIYTNIYIDEVQDLAGYDLNFLKLLFGCGTETLLVGDPRQGTYSTNNASKNKQFKKSDIIHFFEDDTLGIETDDKKLLINYRCIKSICDLSNKLFPDFTATTTGNSDTTEHDGLFFIREKDVADYLLKFNPMQLRDKKTQSVNENFAVMNFGESKGLSFERVLIYPTKPILEWLKSNAGELAPTSRSKFYVAITRARSSVGIVYNYNDKLDYEGFTKYQS